MRAHVYTDIAIMFYLFQGDGLSSPSIVGVWQARLIPRSAQAAGSRVFVRPPARLPIRLPVCIPIQSTAILQSDVLPSSTLRVDLPRALPVLCVVTPLEDKGLIESDPQKGRMSVCKTTIPICAIIHLPSTHLSTYTSALPSGRISE